MSENNTSYAVLAFYLFAPLADPHGEVEQQRAFLEKCDATARIYISEEGINGQLCLRSDQLNDYCSWMHSRPPFEGLHIKVHHYHEHVYPRLTIKYRPQLVALDRKVDLQKRGSYLSPQQWRAKLDEEKKDYILLDVRNQYEWRVGHFNGAVVPPCETFREFDAYGDELLQEVGPDQEIIMCCTGGIRCELYSALLKEKGFNNVAQLQGGIINYGLEEGAKHWQGKLFVFDDRLTVPIAEEETTVCGACHFCQTANESYFNCANMDCNELFICCPSCLKQHNGCCKPSCAEAPRLRPYQQQDAHKPFRRWHHYFKEKPDGTQQNLAV